MIAVVLAAAGTLRVAHARAASHAFVERLVADHADSMVLAALRGTSEPEAAVDEFDSFGVLVRRGELHRRFSSWQQLPSGACSEGACWRVVDAQLQSTPKRTQHGVLTAVQRRTLIVTVDAGSGCGPSGACERVTRFERAFAYRGFLDFQLHFGLDGVPPGAAYGQPAGARHPFVAGDVFAGPVHTNSLSAIPVCGPAQFSFDIEYGSPPGSAPSGFDTVATCTNTLVPPVQVLAGGQIDIAGLGGGAARAVAEGTSHTGDITVDLTAVTSTARSDGTPLPGAQTDVVIHSTGDISVSGTVEAGRNVVVVAGDDVIVTGDVAPAGSDGVLGLVALTGDVVLDVPGDLTITDTAILAAAGGLVNLHWNEIADADNDGTPDPCPQLQIDGSVWLAYRGLLGTHDAVGTTISGHCVTYRFPADWAIRSPAWWPQFAEDNWLPES
ncbi:MAG: DUF342 domain-containing protein [Gemmatimonadetes bacterium]|nr:DUF342 domain-containing protein [Gemmatimonadota bacterium]